jgi:hypothetical protein
MISLETRYRSVVHYKYFLRSLRKVCNIYNVSKSSLHRWEDASGFIRFSTAKAVKAERHANRAVVCFTAGRLEPRCERFQKHPDAYTSPSLWERASSRVSPRRAEKFLDNPTP